LLRGWPLVYTETAAMTLDEDDIVLADGLLADRSDWRSIDPVVDFERQFAAWNGSAAAFAFVSGRVALAAVLDALGVEPGSDVIVPGYTCVVVANAVRAAGLNPVFADIELDTYGFDKDALRHAITPRTRAVVLQHLYGYVCRDFASILELAAAHRLRVVEDCAQAAGATYHGRKVGTFGDAAIFSGDPSKPFDCIQGGVAATNDEEIARRLSAIRRDAALQDEPAIATRLRNRADN